MTPNGNTPNNGQASYNPSGQSYGHPSQNSAPYYVNGAVPNTTGFPPNAQVYSTAYGGTQWERRTTDQTLPSTTYPYRPRPSPNPSSGERRQNFCEHGASFDCGYGCHARTSSPHTPPSQHSPGYASPSPSYPGTPSSSSLSPPLVNRPYTAGIPGYAALPSRMAPGPKVNVDDPKFTSPDPVVFPASPGMPAPSSGQSRYASLPARMAPGPSVDSASDTPNCP